MSLGSDPRKQSILAGGEVISEYQFGAIQARSTVATSPNIMVESFDLAILFASGDSRCLSVVERKFRAKRIVVLADNIQNLAAVENAKSLSNFASRVSDAVEFIEIDSIELEAGESKFFDFLGSLEEFGRPMQVLVDLSGSSRYHVLAVISKLLSGTACEVSVSYAEGKYPDESSVEDRHEMFTKGRWEIVGIPGLEGDYDPAKVSSWLVSIGFEGSKTARAVRRGDPSMISVLVADPSANVEYVERTWNNNKWLQEDYIIPDGRIIRCPSGDAVNVWSEIEKANLDDFENENVSYITAGAKPHALGMALRSIARRSPAVIYLKPDGRKDVAVIPNGRHWTYLLTDLSAL